MTEFTYARRDGLAASSHGIVTARDGTVWFNAGRAGQSARIPPDADGASGWTSLPIPASPNGYDSVVQWRPVQSERRLHMELCTP